MYNVNSVLFKALHVEVSVCSSFLLTMRLSCVQAETRAEFAERSVAKLEKSIDDLEGMRSLLSECLHNMVFFTRSLYTLVIFSQHVCLNEKKSLHTHILQISQMFYTEHLDIDIYM